MQESWEVDALRKGSDLKSSLIWGVPQEGVHYTQSGWVPMGVAS